MTNERVAQAGPPNRRVWPWVALVVTGYAVIAAATMVAAQLSGGGDTLRGLAVRAGGGLLVVSFVWWAARHLRRGRVTGFGLGSPRRGWLILAAVAVATTVAVSLLVAAAVLTGSASFNGSSLAEAAMTALALVPLLLIASALPEELVFRGYVQHALGRHLAPMSMIATQAALFAVVSSLIGMSASGALTAFLTGVGLGYLRLFSRGLWAVLGMRISMTVTSVIIGQMGLEFTEAATFWNLALGVGSFVVALVVGTRLRPASSRGVGQGDQATRAVRELTQKGILYDVGSSYMPGQHSRPRWRPEVVREELRVIDEDLHCTSVLLFGESPQRLAEAAQMALDQGLHVWLQPRRFDASVPQVLDNLIEVADIAERLRAQAPERVGLIVGCEVSLLHRGVLPGGLTSRTRCLVVVSALAPPYLGWRLGRILRQMAGAAREHFSGPVTYGAGTWESVDWKMFDAVGVNYYTDEMTQSDYRGGLRRLAKHGKPVLVTEYGCCSYQGAQDKGGSGADIMDWSNLDDRRIKGDHRRDEQVQADHIEAQLDVFETEDVHGAFLCMFIEGDCHYSPDPSRDLDMASFGIVRPPAAEAGLSADDGHWQPKLAFHALARRYSTRIQAEPR